MRFQTTFLFLLMTLTGGTACAGLSVQTVWEPNSDVVADCGMSGAGLDFCEHGNDVTASEASRRVFLRAIFGESGSDGSDGSMGSSGRSCTSLSSATFGSVFAWHTESGCRLKFPQIGKAVLPPTPEVQLPFLDRKFVPT